MKNFWSERRVCITGGGGFLGSFVVDLLTEYGCKQIFVPRSKDYDLVDQEQIRKMYIDAMPDIVIHLAAVVGGIGANRENPGKFFYDNLMMGVPLLHQGYLREIEKFVAIGTICAYPKFSPVPFKEEDLWVGYPEETNAPYGLAKKMMLVQSQAYREQYGFNSIFLLPVNLYGPRDNFNPDSSHVIPALIKKVYDAQKKGDKEIIVWGDGAASREFLHSKDAARGILMATKNYNKSEPVNIGMGFEITIKELVEKIASLMEFDGKIIWDATKPNGQPRRCLDIEKARREFGFKAAIDFDQGLFETITWYRKNAGELEKSWKKKQLILKDEKYATAKLVAN